MAKAIKGNAWRKPPEPSANHFDIDDRCRHLMPDLQPIVKRLDKSIRATVSDLDYTVKWKRAYYGLPGTSSPWPTRHHSGGEVPACP
jgi:hypothetical protein